MEQAHTLTVENQKRVLATGVAEVNGFSDREIKISLISGKKIYIAGEGLKITNFQKKTGEFVADGEIVKVCYMQSGKNLFKRLVK